MPWKRTNESFPTLVDSDKGVFAVVDHSPPSGSELVLKVPGIEGKSLRVPVGDLLWLMRESGIDWRAGLERLPLTDPAVARERERVRANEDNQVYAALNALGVTADDAETRNQRR